MKVNLPKNNPMVPLPRKNTEKKGDTKVEDVISSHPIENTLNDWTPLFQELGVSPKLLDKCFQSEEVKPDFKKLYDNIKKFQKFNSLTSNFSRMGVFKETWQIYCLCEEPLLVKNLPLEKISLNLKDYQGIHIKNYLSLANPTRVC